MVAYGVPILCSDFGGASELCSSDIFKFKGANKEDFITKLTQIVNNPDLLEQYWQHHSGLMTMERHVQELLGYYKVAEI
jgi:glycosyltransferase involved in cell wall biosynthesis